MRGIFISYRREDAAGYAGRLYDRLAGHFGAERVFMDVEGIEPGVDFVEAIERAVASCEVVIVIIGQEWLAADGTGKRRLDDPADFVRIETAAALARQIRVVPVLVEDAVMPRADQLPPDLAPLVRRQAVELSHKQWDATSAELVRRLERVLDGDKAPGAADAPAAPSPHDAPEAAVASPPTAVVVRGTRRYWAIGGTLALAAAAVGLYFTHPWKESAAPSPSNDRVAVAPPAEKTATPPPAPLAEKASAPPSAQTPAKATAPTPSQPPAVTPAPTFSEAPAVAPAPPSSQAPAATPAPPASPTPVKTPASPSARGAEKSPAAPLARPAEKPSAPPARPAEKPSAPAAGASVAAPAAVAPPVIAPAASAPSALPRVGDTWEYRRRSMWKTVEPRSYAHQVTAVSAREVRETISVVASAGSVAAIQAFTPDTRFVEWRGQGIYFLEFNPFLEAFGELQNPASVSKLPAMPAEDPFFGNWYTRGRIVGTESVTVPAGTFKAVKFEINSNRPTTASMSMGTNVAVRILLVIWYAPEVKRTARMVRTVFTPSGSHLDEDTYELVRYRIQ